MDTTEQLLARIDAAMARIRAAADENLEVEHDGETLPMFRKVRRLNRARDALQQELTILKSKRDQDVAEMDALLAQLKPLIGED